MRPTLATVLEEWLAMVRAHASTPHCPATSRSSFHIVPVSTLGNGRGELTRLLDAKRASGLSPRSVQYIAGTLRAGLGMAERWGLVTRNVAELTEPGRNGNTAEDLASDRCRGCGGQVGGRRVPSTIDGVGGAATRLLGSCVVAARAQQRRFGDVDGISYWSWPRSSPGRDRPSGQPLRLPYRSRQRLAGSVILA